MRLRSVSSWLVPTFGGCVGATWIAVTLLGIFGPIEPLLGDRFDNWLVAMLVATPLALMLGAVLCACDVALVRWRRIPTGAHALAISAAAPLLVGAVYALHRPGRYGDALLFALAILLPMVAVAVATRLVLGRKPLGA